MGKQLFDPAEVLTSWYQDYHKLIRKSILQHGSYSPEDVEDFIAETFLRAYRSLVMREELPGYPKNWLIKIAKNLCNQSFRDTDEYQVVSISPGSAFETAKECELEDDIRNLPEYIVERYELTRELQGYLQELPEEQRRAVLLHYVEELPFAQIAAKYPSRAPSTVGKDAHRGIEQLRVRFTHFKREHMGERED